MARSRPKPEPQVTNTEERVAPPEGTIVGDPYLDGITNRGLPSNQEAVTDDDTLAQQRGNTPRALQGTDPGNVERGADLPQETSDPKEDPPGGGTPDFQVNVGPPADKGTADAEWANASFYLGPAEMKQIDEVGGEVATWLPNLLNSLCQRAYLAGQEAAGVTVGQITATNQDEFERGRAQGRKDMSPVQ